MNQTYVMLADRSTTAAYARLCPEVLLDNVIQTARANSANSLAGVLVGRALTCAGAINKAAGNRILTVFQGGEG